MALALAIDIGVSVAALVICGSEDDFHYAVALVVGFVDGLNTGFADALANDGFGVGFGVGFGDSLTGIFIVGFIVGAAVGLLIVTDSEFGWPHLPVTNFEMPFLRP